MLRRTSSNSPINFTFEGETIPAQSGDSVASAMLAHGTQALRVSTRRKVKRGPYCMMGACYECLVEIDGKTVQSCMTNATDGLRVSRVNHEDV